MSTKTLKLKNGDSYEGDYNEKEMKMQGNGIYKFVTGTVYQGEFKNNKFEGNGVLTCKEFTIKGEFAENAPSGMCIIEYQSGDKYQGKMKGGQKNGSGVLVFSKNNKECSIYDGEFEDDRFNGKGKLVFRDGTIFEGQFKYGQPHGNGKITHANYKYIGDFRQGKKHGRGIVEYKNGERYEGDFENDLRNGKGEYAYLDGSHYSGEFRNDQKEGKGTLKMLNSKTLYEGYFLSGQYHGEGKYTFNELKIEKTQQQSQKVEIEGQFQENNAEGQCKIMHFTQNGENLGYYEGEFYHNSKHGPCKFVLIKGKEALGVFTGEFVHNLERVANSNYGKRF